MAEDEIELEVLTPGKVFLSRIADTVVVPGSDGDFGVLPGHAPMLSGVRPGTIDIIQGERVTGRVFVEGGIAEVAGGRCTVLAEQAIAVIDIVRADAERRLQLAQQAQDDDSGHVEGKDGRELLIAKAMMAALEETDRPK